ncbi:MAG TPA: cupredoxin domain-containing protein [Candidatus Paceibacterota bacterium]|nr:cupredoxin domain-containing protein [Candidatus Paceibacterota bacterium]
MQKSILVSAGLSVLLIMGAVWFVSIERGGSGPAQVASTTPDGTQVIDITAKGGYSPRVIIAKAGVPTILRVSTRGTFDCSSSIVIPKLGFQKFMPPTGTTDIPISAKDAQGTLQGLCAMGMYNFQIRFE